jgi:two-component system phosphate regulon sensor histidine kinase PhoR
MMRSRFFWRLFGGSVAIILLTSLVIDLVDAYGVRRDFLEEKRRSLKAVAVLLGEIAAPRLRGAADPELPARVRRLGSESGTRLTVVTADYTVLADSHEDSARMENHGDRPEFQIARHDGVGWSVRNSATLHQTTLYVAVTVMDGPKLIGSVRAAQPLTQIDAQLSRLHQSVLFGSGVAVLAGCVLVYLFTRRITNPLRAMTQAASAIAAGNYEQRVRVTSSDEFGTVAEAFNRMGAELSERVETITADRGKLVAILEAMVEGVVAINREDVVVHMNDAAARILRTTTREALGRRIWEATRLTQVSESLEHAMRQGNDLRREVTLPEGTRDRALGLHARPLRDSRGAVAGAIVVLHDLTELRRLEAIRRDFVANVSHEIKTPVTAIRGMAETLVDDPTLDTDTRHRYLTRIKDQSLRLSALVTDLLTLSRVESEDAFQDRVDLDLRSVVTGSVRAMQPGAESRRLQLTNALPEHEIRVRADAEALREAVDNLLDNAIKYTPEGGRIQVRLLARADQVAIEVEDTGVGIEPQHLDRIFERFYRVDKARSRELGGTGLGLSIVKHVVLSHGGKVSVESTPGRGSTFRIELPAYHGED